MLRSLKPPPADADPRETFRWIRRCEIVGGLYAIVIGVILWNAGWWHWIPIGLGVVSIAPLGGASWLLRKAERDPGVFVTDPQRRRERENRVLTVFVPFLWIFGAVGGFIAGGVGGAIAVGLIAGASGALGAAVFLRWLGPR